MHLQVHTKLPKSCVKTGFKYMHKSGHQAASPGSSPCLILNPSTRLFCLQQKNSRSKQQRIVLDTAVIRVSAAC